MVIRQPSYVKCDINQSKIHRQCAYMRRSQYHTNIPLHIDRFLPLRRRVFCLIYIRFTGHDSNKPALNRSSDVSKRNYRDSAGLNCSPVPRDAQVYIPRPRAAQSVQSTPQWPQETRSFVHLVDERTRPKGE